mmetsp:Transcript_13910/g.30326  ORF Transcript_13910/g.30326 Transcript_13910/m.30326 type:complete len:156 (-) Transcript_13910:2538-3005(-)
MMKSITNLLLSLLLLNSIMFVKSFTNIARTTIKSSVALQPRAAVAVASTTSNAAARLSSPSLTCRWMSSPNEGEISIVDTCREKIVAALETDDVMVMGAYDDPNGSHISIEVRSALFEGKRPVQRQQLVYKALWEELKGAVHAVDSMVCKTPDEK